jgi:hypothetical protein
MNLLLLIGGATLLWLAVAIAIGLWKQFIIVSTSTGNYAVTQTYFPGALDLILRYAINHNSCAISDFISLELTDRSFSKGIRFAISIAR